MVLWELLHKTALEDQVDKEIQWRLDAGFELVAVEEYLGYWPHLPGQYRFVMRRAFDATRALQEHADQKSGFEVAVEPPEEAETAVKVLQAKGFEVLDVSRLLAPPFPLGHIDPRRGYWDILSQMLPGGVAVLSVHVPSRRHFWEQP